MTKMVKNNVNGVVSVPTVDENILGTRIFGQMILTAKYLSTCVTGPQNYNWTGWYILGVITPVRRVVVAPPPPPFHYYLALCRLYYTFCSNSEAVPTSPPIRT